MIVRSSLSNDCTLTEVIEIEVKLMETLSTIHSQCELVLWYSRLHCQWYAQMAYILSKLHLFKQLPIDFCLRENLFS